MNLLITGGAGFIGTNAAIKFANEKNQVTLLDNFSRKTAKINALFLKRHFPKIKIIAGDVRKQTDLKSLIKKNEVILHLAAQVAVTTSITNPKTDFETNCLGSFNVLELCRKYNPQSLLLYSSTNKVYGNLQKIKVDKKVSVNEKTQIDLYSPYGCSKGAADLYFLDYYRSYGLKTIVFRQSCIYGPHQFGMEDQGWLAFFVLQFLRQKSITIYGTGRQVRDLLYVDDLIEAYSQAIKQEKVCAGKVFNIGGGIENSLSILQALKILEKKVGYRVKINFAPKRLGDQDYFVSDNRKIKEILGWKPKVAYQKGLDQLITWCRLQKI